MAKPDSTAPLGEGGRFAAMENTLRNRGNVQDPKAVAAAIGRKKYGAGKMAKLAAAGKK